MSPITTMVKKRPTVDDSWKNAGNPNDQLTALGKLWNGTTNQYLRNYYHTQANGIRDSQGLKAGVDYNPINGAAIPKQPTVQPTTNTAPVPQGNADLINSIYNNSYNSQLQKLRAARDQQLAGLAGQDNLINQQAIGNLNANDVTYNDNARRLREMMADNGLSSSGDNITANLSLANARQQGQTDINMDKANKLRQLMAQRDAITNNANADDLSLMQQLQAERGQNLLNDAYKQDDKALRLAEMMGVYNGNKTLQGKQFDSNEQQRGLDNSFRDKQFNSSEQQRGLDNSFRNQQFASGEQQRRLDNLFRDKTFNEDVRQFGMNYALDKAVKNHQMSNEDAQLALQRMNINSQIANRNADNARLAAGNNSTVPSGPTSKGYNYRNDSDFLDAYSSAVNSTDKKHALAVLEGMSAEMIKRYGKDGYEALHTYLVNATKPKK